MDNRNASIIYILLTTIIICALLYIVASIFIINDGQLKYIINKFVNVFPINRFDNEVKINIYTTLVDFIIKLRNIKLGDLISINKQIVPEIVHSDIIEMPTNMDWDSQIKYCSKKDGYIEDIYYDETVRPTKPSMILY